MPDYGENVGFEEIYESEEVYMGFLHLCAQRGKPILGYYGLPYLNTWFDDTQIIVRTEKIPDVSDDAPEDVAKISIVGMDTHCAGPCIWDVVVVSDDFDRKDAGLLEKRIVAKKTDDEGCAVFNIVNADILPSYAVGEKIKLQVIALPQNIEYFANDDEYSDSLEKDEKGDFFGLDDGCLFPYGLLTNRNPNSEDFDKNEEIDDLMLVKGKVKNLYYGMVQLDENKPSEVAFIHCIIETHWGDLDIVHSIRKVNDNQRKNIKIGSTVSCSVVLSADPLMYEYENGIVKDEKNHLKLLRYVTEGCPAERMSRVLSDQIHYYSELTGVELNNKNEIINRFQYITNKRKKHKYKARYGVLNDEKYPEKRCLLLYSPDKPECDEILIINMNQDNNISEIKYLDPEKYEYKELEGSD